MKLGWILLLLIAAVYFFANLQKVIIPGAAFDELQQMFSLDASEVTRLGAIFLGVYAVAQLITGVMADRFGGAKVIIAGGVIFCAGSLMSAVDSSLPLFYFSRIFTGVGAASIYLSMVKEIDRIAGRAMPMVLGVVMIIGYSGSITGASPFIAGVNYFGYSKMIFITGITTTFFYLLYVMFAVHDKFPPVNKEVKFRISSYVSVFKSMQNVRLITAVGISFGVYFAIQSNIGKKFLEDFCGMSVNGAGTVLTATMIIAAVNGFIVANISRWCGNRRLPIILFCGFGCFIGAMTIFFTVLFRLPAWVAVTGMLLMAFAGNVAPIYVALLKESNENHRFGTVICTGNSFAYALSALFCAAAGKLMDLFPPQLVGNIKVYGRNSYLLVFGIMTISGVISAVIVLRVRESFGKQLN